MLTMIESFLSQNSKWGRFRLSFRNEKFWPLEPFSIDVVDLNLLRVIHGRKGVTCSKLQSEDFDPFKL